ncbi:hypothetical protein P7C70_g8220, partial [Phenoliferia sp. Uapishka_3]
MYSSTLPLRPSSLPLVFLLSSFALPSTSTPSPTLDALIELSLELIYEDDHPNSLGEWLNRVATVEGNGRNWNVGGDGRRGVAGGIQDK